jgi:GDP-D-mannose dehydratase
MTDLASLIEAVRQSDPDEVYNLGTLPNISLLEA